MPATDGLLELQPDALSQSPTASIASLNSRTPSTRVRRKEDEGYQGEASWASSIINLLNTIVGAGTLAMPHALSQMGMLLGIIFIVWSASTSAFGLYLQTRCSRYVPRGQASFFALSQITYPNLAIIFDAAIAIKCFGVGISYLIIIGDLMPGVVLGFNPGAGEIGYVLDRHFWITVFMLVLIPLTFLRRLDSLKYTSIIALSAIGYLIILVLFHFIKGDTLPDRGQVRYVTWVGPTAFLSNLPVMIFAYTCHQNIFAILNEIKINTPIRTASVAITSIGSACFIYILVAITGYLSYGSNVKGNIISMYPPTAASTIGRAAIVVLVVFSYPLQAHPCRASINGIINWRPIIKGSRPPNSAPLTKKLDISDARFAILTTLIIVASYLVAMTVSSLQAVLAYVGSTGSTSISFILPGLFYYKISTPDNPAHQRLLQGDIDNQDVPIEEEEEEEEGAEADRDTVAPADGEENPLLSTSIASLHSLTKGAKFLSNIVWPKDLLRKLSLALALYGVVIMIVCLVTNIVLHSSQGH